MALHPAAGPQLLGRTWEAAAALKALKMTSVTRWLVSTLPPTTAAWSLGLSRVPGGMVMVTGARQPCQQHSYISCRAPSLASSCAWLTALPG